MKLSFSTKGWQSLGWQRLCELARDVKLSGMEIHDPFDAIMSERVLDTQNVPLSRRQLQEAGLQIASVDLPVDLTDTTADFSDRFERTVTAAINMRCAHIRIHTLSSAEDGQVPAIVMERLNTTLSGIGCGLSLSVKRFHKTCRQNNGNEEDRTEYCSTEHLLVKNNRYEE